MTDDERYKLWDQWLGILEGEVSDLRVNQHIFWEVQKLIQANPKIHQPGDFNQWMGSMYAAAMSVAVRRLVDHDPDSISFNRLLGEIMAHPGVLSRSRYKSKFADSKLPEDYQDKGFDKLVGKGRSYVDPSVVANEIQVLNSKTNLLRRYVNKRIAHRDKKDFKAFPKFQDLDDAIDYLEGLLKRYFLLFRAISFATVLPVWQYDWKAIFRHPWNIESECENVSMQLSKQDHE